MDCGRRKEEIHIERNDYILFIGTLTAPASDMTDIFTPPGIANIPALDITSGILLSVIF